jgi:hypothetical protein
MAIGESVRAGLTVLGANGPRDLPRLLNSAANYLDTGRRLRDLDMPVPGRLPDRLDVLECAAVNLDSQAPLYLEFGVYRGETMRFMASHVEAPGATLIGFDSFEGLPENWTRTAQQGHFSTQGQPPVILDDRVTFRVGWFDETLASFALPEHDRLLVNVDSDLYASANVVLQRLAGDIGIGDLLYFDEFHDRLHEGRAFAEHLSSTSYRYEVLAATRALSQILFRRTA